MKPIIALLALIPILHLMAAENPFVGQWQPDMEATIENAKKDPKFKVEDQAKMEQILSQIIGSMRMEMTPTTLTMRFGKSREQSTAYTVESVSDSEVVLALHVSEDKSVGMTIQPAGDQSFSLEIEGNNDMNLYVWKPAKSMEAEDPNMAVIAAAAMGGKKVNETTGTPPPSIEKTIQNNLRIISSAADQYSLEYGVISAPYSKLEGDYFKTITPVNGESYKDLVIQSSDKEISVTDQNGTTHTFKRR